MKRRSYKVAILLSFILVFLLSGCEMNTKSKVITEGIENHLQKKYGEEFEVLSWNQPKLLPSDNGAIYATCIAKNDPKHPFEGSYFYPEEQNAEIEVLDDGYVERLLARQLESMTEEVISKIANDYYIQVDIETLNEEWQTMPVEEISQWKNYVTLCNHKEDPDERFLGDIRVYLDATTMIGKTDEEEYQMYEELFREKIGGEALIFIYYMDKKNFQQAKEILEVSAFGNGGSQLSEAKENQPYFGTIMRNGSDIFDDSLEVFKAAKRGEEQKK